MIFLWFFVVFFGLGFFDSGSLILIHSGSFYIFWFFDCFGFWVMYFYFLMYWFCGFLILFRGTEKLCEFKTPEQCVPYFDRLDYVSVCCNEHCFCLVFEYMLRCSLSLRLSCIRLYVCEYTRIFNGLLCIACMFMDMGCLSPLLWSFEERCKIMTFFDLCCGTRMHCAFLLIMGIMDDFFIGVLEFCIWLLTTILFLLDIYDYIGMHNRLLYLRLRGLALLDVYDIAFTSISGCMARSTGVVWDCRLYNNYDIYFLLYFQFCFCIGGDALDRFCIRLFDMRMSILMIKQIIFLGFVQYGYLSCFDYMLCELVIESIIMLFYSIWCIVLPGISLASIEHPKGEYSVVVAFVYGLCIRVRIRCADFIHLCLLDFLLRGFLLHDLVALLGNIDVVFGSVDR